MGAAIGWNPARVMREWLWGDLFPLPTARLPISAPSAPGQDLLSLAQAHLSEIHRLSELATSFEERRTTGSESELREVARSMLPALDALDRLIEGAHAMSAPPPEMENWLQAIEALAKRLNRTMEKIGLVPIGCVGAEVDLNVHDVVATVASREYRDGTIVAERLKGYVFRGKLLRDAKVVVAVSH